MAEGKVKIYSKSEQNWKELIESINVELWSFPVQKTIQFCLNDRQQLCSKLKNLMYELLSSLYFPKLK